MKSKYLPVYLFIFVSSITLLFARHVKQVFSTADHIVISEIQISGSSEADDEFVELYNPTNSSIDLTGWRLNKTSSSGTPQNLVASMSGSIPSHGYFLVANPDYDGSVIEDVTYSATSSAITSNNTVNLFSDAGSTLVDRVGFGAPFNAEGTPFPTNPAAEGSIERKPGESNPTGGNGEDTENNAGDFAVRTLSDPQNSSSATEFPIPTPSLTPGQSPTMTPTESPTPTPSNTPTPTETLTPTPTDTPTPTATSTNTPTLTLTETPTPSDTPTPTDEAPSPTPTESPTETPIPTPTPTPSESETPTPAPFFKSRLFECHTDYIKVYFIGFSIYFPQFHCVRI